MTSALNTTEESLAYLDGLLERYTPEPEVDVVLPGGETLRFRTVKGYPEWLEFKARAAEFAKKCSVAAPKGSPFHGLTPVPFGAGFAAFTVAEFSVEPKIGHKDALRLLRAPAVIDAILAQLDLANRNAVARVEAAELDAKKKGSKETAGEGS